MSAIPIPLGARSRRAPGSATLRRVMPGPHVVVVGAGAFGGFVALDLVRRGARVTLLDAWGPANPRASSGGETRILRLIYGDRRVYVELAARALELWRQLEARTGPSLFTRTGSLWLLHGSGGYVMASLPLLRELGFGYDELTAAEAARLYPQMRLDDVEGAVYEREAGVLLARRACEVVLELFLAEGGAFHRAAARPGAEDRGALEDVVLSDGTRLGADEFVFACGPWLPELFRDLLAGVLVPSRQEVFTFGTPAGDGRFHEGRLPIWMDMGERYLYGIPARGTRGLKIADDTHGAPFDPTNGERIVSPEGLAAARAYLARRFPLLAGAPLVDSRVCQYENTPDAHLILDRHPELENVWIAGGGSGHGYKHGPAVGEIVAEMVLGDGKPDPAFSLARFAG
jgi:sarcosine oxidase